MNIFQVGAELLHAGGRTEGRTTYMTKLIVAFRKLVQKWGMLRNVAMCGTRVNTSPGGCDE